MCLISFQSSLLLMCSDVLSVVHIPTSLDTVTLAPKGFISTSRSAAGRTLLSTKHAARRRSSEPPPSALRPQKTRRSQRPSHAHVAIGDRYVAAKSIDNQRHDAVARELGILNALDHPNILKFYSW